MKEILNNTKIDPDLIIKDIEKWSVDFVRIANKIGKEKLFKNIIKTDDPYKFVIELIETNNANYQKINIVATKYGHYDTDILYKMKLPDSEEIYTYQFYKKGNLIDKLEEIYVDNFSSCKYLIETFDTLYCMSDDFSVYKESERKLEEIRKLFNTLNNEQKNEIAKLENSKICLKSELDKLFSY